MGLSRRLKSSVLFFPFNQTASFCSTPRPGRKNRDFPIVFRKSATLVNHLLMDGTLHEDMAASPLSFQLVLSLLAAGSQGFTRNDFLRFFKASSRDHLNSTASLLSNVLLADRDPAVGPHMRCSTAVWLDQSLTLKPSFKRVLDSHYTAAVNPVDFDTKSRSVRQQINSRVESETNGRVKDLIGETTLDNKAKLVFTNALYFKGAWDKQCDANSLSTEDRLSENLVCADFMTLKRKQFGKVVNGFQTHTRRYKKQSDDKRFVSMFFCYPHTELTHLTETLMDIDGDATPKFTISSEVEPTNVLKRSRIVLPFCGGGLTGMTTPVTSFDSQELHISNIFQKAFIEINEQGTEAATATTAIVMSGSPPCVARIAPIPSYGHYPIFFASGKNENQDCIIGRAELSIRQLVNPLAQVTAK